MTFFRNFPMEDQDIFGEAFGAKSAQTPIFSCPKLHRVGLVVPFCLDVPLAQTQRAIATCVHNTLTAVLSEVNCIELKSPISAGRPAADGHQHQQVWRIRGRALYGAQIGASFRPSNCKDNRIGSTQFMLIIHKFTDWTTCTVSQKTGWM